MPTGRTADGRFQAGMRRTLPVSALQAWRHWASGAGLRRWLGGSPGQVRVVRSRAPSLLRLRLSGRAWASSPTAQLRILPAARGMTVALHLEGLPDAAARARYLARWRKLFEAAQRSAGRARTR